MIQRQYGDYLCCYVPNGDIEKARKYIVEMQIAPQKSIQDVRKSNGLGTQRRKKSIVATREGIEREVDDPIPMATMVELNDSRSTILANTRSL